MVMKGSSNRCLFTFTEVFNAQYLLHSVEATDPLLIGLLHLPLQ